MKKILLIILLIFTTILTACGYRGYSGERSDLYSVAINSVLWLNGHSWGADFVCDPSIEIIDEDNYGRIMFTYYEKYYKGSNISFSALIICQDSNEKEVFYYEDINYIVKEQPLYSANNENFNEEEIEYLKSINDWNKEINYNKCVKKEITKLKPKIQNEEEIKNQIIEKFKLNNGGFSLYTDYLTANLDDSKYIIYGYVSKTERTEEWEEFSFIGIVDKNDVTKINILVPSNVYDYTMEVIEFKKLNGWY